MLKAAKHMEFLAVRYPQLVTRPDDVIPEIVEFLGDEFLSTPEKMISAIDKSLYRNRVVTEPDATIEK